MASSSPETLYDPWFSKEIPVRDVREAVAEISAVNSPPPESVMRFLENRKFLVQTVDMTRASLSVSGLTPPHSGIALGVVFLPKILGFVDRTAMYWQIVAPEYLGGSSRALVYVTSSNQALRGPEALVEYQEGLPAVFRIWDWATPPQPDGSRFIVNMPFASWGGRHAPIKVGGKTYNALSIVNMTWMRARDEWTNDVFVHDPTGAAADHVWRYEYQWARDPLLYLRWGPIIEAFSPYGYGTTNVLGYANARLVSNSVDTVLKASNSYFLQHSVGFEPLVHKPNHTMIAT